MPSFFVCAHMCPRDSITPGIYRIIIIISLLSFIYLIPLILCGFLSASCIHNVNTMLTRCIHCVNIVLAT